MSGAIERAIKKQSVVIPDRVLRPSDESVGEILVAQGVLNADDVDEIARYAKKQNLPFGEAAVSVQKIRQEDLDEALAQQYRFPHEKPAKDALDKDLVAAYKPFSKQAEIFRYIRAQLTLGTIKNDHALLAVVSPSKKDGRSYLVGNLGIVFAQLGKKTLIMDCHLRKPRQQALFHLPESPGLSAILSGRSDQNCRPTAIAEIPNLAVLQAGACPPNPDELIAGNAFAHLCTRLRREYDVVLVDTPPGDSSTAVDWIAARCNKVLILLRRDRTRLSDARDFADRMQARAEPVGTILNSY